MQQTLPRSPFKLANEDIRYVQKFYQMRTQLQAVSLRIQTVRSNEQTVTPPASATLPWSNGTLNVTQQGTGKPWATIESLAAVALKAPFASGYRITKTVTPIATV